MNTPRLSRPVSLAALFLATSILGASSSDDAPLPKLQPINYGGTGAPQGTVGQSLGVDRETFTLIFDSFVAFSGPGVPITETRKFAEFFQKLSFPHRSAVLTENVRGYVQLDAGMTATVTINAEGGKTTTSSFTFSGPVAMDYLVTGKAFVRPETQEENTSVSIRINGPNSHGGIIQVDSLDGVITAPSPGDGDDDGGDDDGD